nr:MAG TPA: hypothetical protein [Caudoviricetes sp.]
MHSKRLITLLLKFLHILILSGLEQKRMANLSNNIGTRKVQILHYSH